ncbi:MAG: hypothetical protein FWE53_03220 [Firmicutes bacterium]|nr:hypothetical protein [Bacillota bacterium]
MTTKNILRLTISNPRLIWQIFAYSAVSLVLLLGVAVAAGLPLVLALNADGFFTEIQTFWNSLILNANLGEIMQNSGALIDGLWQIFVANGSNLIWLSAVVFFICFIVGPLILGQLDLTIGNCLYGYMGSNSKLSFWGSFVLNIGKSFKLRLIKLFIVLPADILIFTIMFFSLELFALGALWAYFAPFIIILGGCVLVGLRLSLFACWTPNMIVTNQGVFRSLRENFRCGMVKFQRTAISAFVLVLIIFVLNYCFMFFTAGVALLITIPISVLMIYIFGFVIYFQNNGLKFYVDSGTIITPKKQEFNDELSKIKHII